MRDHKLSSGIDFDLLFHSATKVDFNRKCTKQIITDLRVVNWENGLKTIDLEDILDEHICLIIFRVKDAIAELKISREIARLS